MFFLEATKTFEFSCIASSVWRVRLGWGAGAGGGGGVCVGLWEERGGRLTSPGCRCEPLVRRHGSSTQQHDGCYSLTTRLVVMMLVLINQELTETQPVPRAGVHSEGVAPPVGRDRTVPLFSQTKTEAASSLVIPVVFLL